MILDDLDPETRGTLERFRFDAQTFEALRARVASGELSAEANIVKGRVEPPAESYVSVEAEPDAVTDVRTASTLPPPPPAVDGEPAGANGRRGLFGR